MKGFISLDDLLSGRVKPTKDNWLISNKCFGGELRSKLKELNEKSPNRINNLIEIKEFLSDDEEYFVGTTYMKENDFFVVPLKTTEIKFKDYPYTRSLLKEGDTNDTGEIHIFDY